MREGRLCPEARPRLARVGSGGGSSAGSRAARAGRGAGTGVRADGVGRAAPAEGGGLCSRRAALTCAARAIASPAAGAARLPMAPAPAAPPRAERPPPWERCPTASAPHRDLRPARRSPLCAAAWSGRGQGASAGPARAVPPSPRPGTREGSARSARRSPPSGFATCRKAAPCAVATLPCAAGAAGAWAMAAWRTLRNTPVPPLRRALSGRGCQLAPERGPECREAAPSRVSGVPGEVGPGGLTARGASPGRAPQTPVSPAHLRQLGSPRTGCPSPPGLTHGRARGLEDRRCRVGRRSWPRSPPSVLSQPPGSDATGCRRRAGGCGQNCC